MMLALLLACAGGTESTPADSETALPASPEAFCDQLTPSTDPDAVGVSCVDDPDPGRPCDEIAVIMVQKGDVDDLCATCEAAGHPCQHTPATRCTTAEGGTLSVYSFTCGGV